MTDHPGRNQLGRSRICIVQLNQAAVSETFLRAHAERLPGVVAVVHRLNGLPAVGGIPVLSQTLSRRVVRRLCRLLYGEQRTVAQVGYEVVFRRTRATLVLAEFGTVGAEVWAACRRLGLPLVVYFRGFDASVRDVIDSHARSYSDLFAYASAVIAVSRSIEHRLISLGCPAEKILVQPGGVDCQRFAGGRPEEAGPVLVAVGRMVEKKAPYLTIAAFSRVVAEEPDARLVMIGTGPLLGVCRDLAGTLQPSDAVTFLEDRPPAAVVEKMRRARAFVQHSVVASDGDSEGTPNTILEAGAVGLPVVSTRHAGIPEVVVHGTTGFLVDERDVAGMAMHMLQLVRNRKLAGQIGRAAADHVRKHYTVERGIDFLTAVLRAAADGQSPVVLRERNRIQNT